MVARRGETTIVRNHHGLTMAAAGIDNSNVAAGPDRAAARGPGRLGPRAARRRSASAPASTSASIVTDTAGRAWREGQTDIAIGAAGLRRRRGLRRPHRRPRQRARGHRSRPSPTRSPAPPSWRTGKLGGRPFAVVRGRADLVLPAGEHGPGAAALVRADGADLFGYGAREAVVRALRGDAADQRPFGAPAAPAELAAAIARRGRPDPVPHRAGDGALLVTCPRGLVRPLTAADLRLRVDGQLDRPPPRTAVAARDPCDPPVDSAVDPTQRDRIAPHDRGITTWPSPPRPTARRSSTRCARSRRAPTGDAGP